MINYEKTNDEIIEDTIDLIKNLHHGQTDWTGTPYWQHPVAVMERLPPNSPLSRILMALLHDVPEDCVDRVAVLTKTPLAAANTELVFEFLANFGYTKEVLDGVRLLTRDKPNITYLDEIRNIVASGNIDAMCVKLADNEHNTDLHRTLMLPAADQIRAKQMAVRYEKSKAILRQGIAAHTQSQQP